MQKGKIKNYFPEEGYGFIITNDDEEYFFHVNDLHAKSKGSRIYEDMNVALILR